MIRALKKGESIDKSSDKKGCKRLLGLSECTIVINKILNNIVDFDKICIVYFYFKNICVSLLDS